MINTVKSVNFGLRRDKGVLVSIACMAVFPYLMMLFLAVANGIEMNEVTASYYFASQNMAMITILFYVGIVIISCKAMGGDLADKTINYEVLSGHKRSTVFGSRAVAGVMWGTLIPLILAAAPMFVFMIANGWGPETDQKDVMIRTLFTFFPLLRFCALNMMFASLSGSAGRGIAIGLSAEMLMSLLQSFVEEVLHKTIYYGLALTNIMVLLTSQNSREVVRDGKPVMIYETAVNAEMLIKTVCFSLVAGALYMTVAYIIFKKKDRS